MIGETYFSDTRVSHSRRMLTAACSKPGSLPEARCKAASLAPRLCPATPIWSSLTTSCRCVCLLSHVTSCWKNGSCTQQDKAVSHVHLLQLSAMPVGGHKIKRKVLVLLRLCRAIQQHHGHLSQPGITRELTSCRSFKMGHRPVSYCTTA